MIKCAIKINKKSIKLYNNVIIKIKLSPKIFVEAKFKVRSNVILRLGQNLGAAKFEARPG